MPIPRAEGTFTLTLEIELPNDLLNSIMDAALHGGITYWADYEVEGGEGAQFHSHVLTHGGKLIIIDNEDGDERFVLDADKLKLGIVRWLKRRIGSASQEGEHPDQLLYAPDADDADAIVQLALFDEVVYG